MLIKKKHCRTIFENFPIQLEWVRYVKSSLLRQILNNSQTLTGKAK